MSASQLTDKPCGCLFGYVPSWGLSTRWMRLHTYNELFDSLVIVHHVVSVSYSIGYLRLWKYFTCIDFWYYTKSRISEAVTLSHHRPRFCGSAHPTTWMQEGWAVWLVREECCTPLSFCRRHFGEQSRVTIHMFVVRVAGIGGYKEVHSTMSNGTNRSVNT